MSASLRLHEPLGERAATLPLTLGGEGAMLPLPGAEGVLLHLVPIDGQWSAQPTPGAAVALNGVPLHAAQLLDEGDVLGIGTAQLVAWPGSARLDVVHLAGNDTVAPLRHDVLPGEEVVAGVREIFASEAGPGAGNSTAPLPVRRGSARRRLGIFATAAVLVAVAVGLFALVPVPLALAPEGAAVSVAGSFDWRAGDRLFVLPGRRTLTFTHPGYHSQSVTLDVTRALGNAAALQVTLALQPGVLAVDTQGVAGELLVDGRVAGPVPGDVAIEAGSHDLIVRAPRHIDHVERLEIAGGGVRQQLTAPLQSSLGWLVLDTEPTGASIRVDGQEAGAAPQRIELESGLRQLSIVAPGRRAWSSQVAIIAGQTLDLGRVDLALPPPPAVRAAATVPSAEVTGAAPEMPAAAVVARPPPPARVRSALLGTLVLLPAGKYQQGSDRREQGRRANEAQREVVLTRAFYLAETEVTNAQFRAFRAAHASGIAMEKSVDLDPQAVTGVSWSDAVEFCNWLSLREGLPAAYERRDGRWQLVLPHNAGYRLPTEAEWEYAARYVDGHRWQRYAWGDALPPPAGAANLAGQESLPTRPGPDVRLATALPGYRDEHAVVAPVGSYARTAIGLLDMGGNVSEWTHDVYVSLPEAGQVSDPVGAATDGPHAIRGANWRTAAMAELRLAWRERATAASPTIGFRVARLAEATP